MGFILNIFHKVVSSILVCSIVLPFTAIQNVDASSLINEKSDTSVSYTETKLSEPKYIFEVEIAPVLLVAVPPIVGPTAQELAKIEQDRLAEEARLLQEEIDEAEREQAALEAKKIKDAENAKVTAEKNAAKEAKALVEKETASKTIIAPIEENINLNSNNSDTITSMIAYAKKFIGTPYRYGGTTPSGFDCSGYTSYIYKNIGISLPRTARDQYAASTKISKSELMPGDLVFFATNGSRVSHVGIYIGDGKMIHSPQTGYTVEIKSITSGYFSRTYYGAGRYA